MGTARIFSNGRSQAVRIPKEYRFDVDEVYINKIGNVLVLVPKADLAAEFEKGAAMLSEDFWLKGCRTAFLPLGRHCNVYVGYECHHYGSAASGLADL